MTTFSYNTSMRKFKKINTPVFFPDATRAVLRTLDSTDIQNTHTEGILVNTYHLFNEVGKRILKKHKGVRNFMNFRGGVISDSGGFQVMSLIKNSKMGKIIEDGAVFYPSKNKKVLLTPEKSISFQFEIMPDMMVVLDDFTHPNDDWDAAKLTVERTLRWAKRSKDEFEKQIMARKITKKNKPYLLAVIQGGKHQDLREFCAKELVKIGFDGFGYGGWPLRQAQGKPDIWEFDYESAKTIADNTPKNYFLYGLGIGKPNEIVNLVKMGYNIFDCVLPTRDARHGRLYVYTADSIKNIDINSENFWKFFSPKKQKYAADLKPISTACDCLLCANYSRSYLGHLFRIKDVTAMRLATIHNLRFYSILMQKLKQ